MCEWKPDFDALNKRVDGIEIRMTQVERLLSQGTTNTVNVTVSPRRFSVKKVAGKIKELGYTAQVRQPHMQP